MKYKKSILTDNMGECYICKHKNVEIHHVYYGKNRKKATEDGCVIPLCYIHHRGMNGVHGKNGGFLNTELKQKMEKRWLEYYHKDIEDFIKKYGRNYL